MIDYVENVHLKYQAIDKKVVYYYPTCKSEGLVLNDVNHFKNHISRVYSITLQEPRYVD